MKKFLSLLVLSFIICSCSGLRLLTYNVRNAKGMDNKTDYNRVASVIKNAGAHIVALQELDSATKRSNNEDVVKFLGEKTGLFSVYGSAIDYQGGKYGVGILSKEKPLRHYTVPLPGKEEKRVLLVAEFKKHVIFCTHLSLTDADRMASADIINREAAKFSKPVYLLGDLNAEPSSAVITTLRQQWTLLSSEEPTFPADTPVKCIDYIFIFNNKRTKPVSKVVNESMASDHRPVLAEIKK